MSDENAVFSQQGFGAGLGLHPPFGLLLIDFVNGFADPAVFGGGNISAAIERSLAALSRLRTEPWTSWPAVARWMAVARPMPELAPVTTETVFMAGIVNGRARPGRQKAFCTRTHLCSGTRSTARTCTT